jgi:RecA-family ATPase
LSKVRPEALRFLWPGRLAEGKLAMFDGDPDRGKSLVTLDLCARVTSGRPMPDGSAQADPANVLIINGEDGVADTILPRLQALGGDPTVPSFLTATISQAKALLACLTTWIRSTRP